MVIVTPDYRPPDPPTRRLCQDLERKIQGLAPGQEAQALRYVAELERLDPGGPRGCRTLATLSMLENR